MGIGAQDFVEDFSVDIDVMTTFIRNWFQK